MSLLKRIRSRRRLILLTTKNHDTQENVSNETKQMNSPGITNHRSQVYQHDNSTSPKFWNANSRSVITARVQNNAARSKIPRTFDGRKIAELLAR